MFGPALNATGGISNVVNNWLEAGIREKLDLDYVSTLDDNKPGLSIRKAMNAIRALCVLILKGRASVDLVHLHLSMGMSFYRKLIIFGYAKLRGLKTVVHLHGSRFVEFYEKGSWLRKRLIRWVFDRSDAVFVLSETWKAFVQGLSSNNNIIIIYNGASIEKFGDKITNPDRINILFMGRLEHRKGIYDLLEVFARLSAEVPEAHLVLGGDGDVEEVRAIVRDKGLANRIDVLGWVSGDQKIRVFKQADIYVLPSYNEGLPGSILEAMAAGAPILSTPVGGIAEAVKEGQNGFLVKPGDIDGLYARMLQLCQDADLRRAMGGESRRLIEKKFDINRIVNDVMDAYRTTLS